MTECKYLYLLTGNNITSPCDNKTCVATRPLRKLIVDRQGRSHLLYTYLVKSILLNLQSLYIPSVLLRYDTKYVCT